MLEEFFANIEHEIPPRLERVLQVELEKLKSEKTFELSPARRLLIYNLIGETANADFLAPSFEHNGSLKLTRADRVRARTAIFTAQKVADVWSWNIENFGHDSRQKEKQVTARSLPIWEWDPYQIPISECFEHLLNLALAALEDQKSDIAKISGQSCEIHYFSSVTTETGDCAFQAAKEALNIAMGYNIFELLYDIHGKKPKIENNRLVFHDAAADFASRAFAGVLGDSIPEIVAIDQAKSREFWIWWLSEAIPQAWQQEADFVEPNMDSYPYWKLCIR